MNSIQSVNLHKPAYVILLSLLLSTCGLRYEKIDIGEIHRIQSESLIEIRDIYISIPEGYSMSETSYPVIYLLDGDNHFSLVAGITNFLSEHVQIPQLIIVGIPSQDSVFNFTQNIGDTSGQKEDKFGFFIEQEVVPYIESNYRTQPFRILAGHSQEGYWTLNSLLTNPGFFNAYFSISPWVSVEHELEFENLSEFLSAKSFKNNFLYIAYAESEFYLDEPMEALQNQLTEYAPADLNWMLESLEGECHESTPLSGIYNGLKTLYGDWRVTHRLLNSDRKSINEHFKMVSEKFGYTIPIPEAVLNIVGYRVLESGDINEALDIFKQNVETYPNSANVYDSLGEAYEFAGRLDLALKNYLLAYEKAMRLDDPFIETYKGHISRARKMIKDNKGR